MVEGVGTDRPVVYITNPNYRVRRISKKMQLFDKK